MIQAGKRQPLYSRASVLGMETSSPQPDTQQLSGNQFRVNELFGHLNNKGRQDVEKGRERQGRQ